MKHFEEDDIPKKEAWPAIRDLYAQLIKPAKDWETAEVIAETDEIAKIFIQAFPGVELSMEDLRLALHDLNIPYERNEHNSKFYYLAMWL